MSLRRAAIVLLAGVLVVGGCDYVVVPPDNGAPVSASSKGWTAIPTGVGPGDGGDLEVALTIRNETGNWSAMQAVPDRPAVLTGPDGKTSECATVVVGTGGHRLAPGMQMRGFVSGPSTAPTTALIHVACEGAQAGPGSSLAIDYTYVTGEYNYYDPDANLVASRLNVSLDPIVSDLRYPVAERIETVIVKPDVAIEAINGVVLTLAKVEQTATGLLSTWRTSNPGEYPSFVHIGVPPVIGTDGILYGLYESPDLATVPVTPEGGEVEWTTEVAVPPDVTGMFMMLSVESKKQRLFVHYALDLSEELSSNP